MFKTLIRTRQLLMHSLILSATMLATPAHAGVEPVEALVPDARLVGEGRLRVLIWKVFDARLYAPGGEWKPDGPFALSLSYLRKLDGELIAKRTISEIRDQGFTDEEKLQRWFEQIVGIFPDVDSNTTITGIRNDSGKTVFYSDERFMGQVDDPEFSERFFAIWLGEQTSEPRLRRKLLGV